MILLSTHNILVEKSEGLICLTVNLSCLDVNFVKVKFCIEQPIFT